MKQIVEKVAFDNNLISKPLACVLDVMGTLSGTWPCVREIREGIVSYIRGQEEEQECGRQSQNQDDQNEYHAHEEITDFIQTASSFFSDLPMDHLDKWRLLAQDPNLGTMEAFARDLGFWDPSLDYGLS